MVYIIAPLVAWLVAGSLKFAINTLRARTLAWKQVGLGSLPSTHTTIVSTTAFLIGLKHGFDTPAFAVAWTVVVIVVLDALDLRRHVGRQASALNLLLEKTPGAPRLRDRIGHHPHEVAAGITTAFGCAWMLHVLLP